MPLFGLILGRRVHVALMLVVAGAAVVAATILLLRPEPDFDLGGGSALRGTGGIRELLDSEGFGTRRVQGKGTLTLLGDVENLHDEPLTLAVPQPEQERLGRLAIRASVGFARTSRSAPLGEGTTPLMPRNTVPPRAYGVLVHSFAVSDCDRSAGKSLRRLPLEVDGRTAKVGVTAQGKTEVRDYADEAFPVEEPISFVGC